MAWHTIPDSDIDGNSALKTNLVCRYLRDDPEAFHEGTAPTRYNLEACRTEELGFRGYLRPDGLGNLTFNVMEPNEQFIIDASQVWTIPDRVRQIIVEVWGGGGATGSDTSQFDTLAGMAGAYAMKLIDVDHAGGFHTLAITIGAGGDPDGGGDSIVVYKTTTITAPGGDGNHNSNNGFQLATGGDINMGGGWLCAVRGGSNDPTTGIGVWGGPGAQPFSAAANAGGPGRVIVTVLG